MLIVVIIIFASAAVSVKRAGFVDITMPGARIMKWAARTQTEHDVTQWTLLGLLVDVCFKLSIVSGLASRRDLMATVKVCNVIKVGEQRFKKPGVKLSVPTKGLKDRAIKIVEDVRKALFAHGWNVIAADEQLPRGAGAVDGVADAPCKPDELALVEVKVRSYKAQGDLAKGRADDRADMLQRFAHSPRPWTRAVLVTVLVDLARPSRQSVCVEEISRASSRTLKEHGWADVGCALMGGAVGRKRARVVVASSPRGRRVMLCLWRHLQGLQFGVLGNRRKAVHLGSYCAAADLHPDTGRKMLPRWARACSWAEDEDYEKQAGATTSGRAPAFFVGVTALQRLHEKRRRNEL